MRSTTLALLPLLTLGLPEAATAQCNAQLLLASDAAAGDGFGEDVHLSGDLAIVGAGDEDEGTGGAGSAYVWRREGTFWQAEQKLVRPTPASNYHFGQAVAIDGDVAVCGVPDDDDFASRAGSVDVFRHDGSSWVHEQQLTAPDAASSDRFGWAVDVQGSVTVVGAKFDDDGGQSNSGSVYVFRHDGASWLFEQKLTAPDPAQNAQFGDALALDGTSIVVGAWQDDDAGFFTGGAYVFVHDGASWAIQQKLNASDQDEFHWFGRSVGISGDLVVCGAYAADVGALQTGAAYVYRRSAGLWAEEVKLSAFAFEDNVDEFGWSVDVTDGASVERVVVGARRDAAPLVESGSVFAFQEVGGGTWVQTDKVVHAGAAGDQLGYSLAMDGDRVLAGAIQADTAAGLDAGSAFGFALGGSCGGPGLADCDCSGGNGPCFNASGVGRGCPNSNPNGLGARLIGSGQVSTNNDTFSLMVLDAAPSKPGLILAGTSSLGPSGLVGVPDNAGLLCVAGTTRRGAVVFTDFSGAASFPDFQGAPYGSSDIVSAGSLISYTFWFRDPGTAAGCAGDTAAADFNFSNGWTVPWL